MFGHAEAGSGVVTGGVAYDGVIPEMTDAKPSASGAEPSRVAVVSLHTSPREQPGSGDSGGMNVYVMEVAERLAEQGIAVDIYTRRDGAAHPDVEELGPRSRLIQVPAGPAAPVPKEELPELVPEFTHGVLTAAAANDDRAAHRHSPYDVVHSHVHHFSGWVLLTTVAIELVCHTGATAPARLLNNPADGGCGALGHPSGGRSRTAPRPLRRADRAHAQRRLTP